MIDTTERRAACARAPQPKASLAHRTASSARRALKRLVWRLRAIAISNPPLPTAISSVLFVCKGNICRSPFAAQLAQRIADQADRRVRCSSAGLIPSRDGRSPDLAILAAKPFGVLLESHVPTDIDDRRASEHDLIVVMEVAHLAAVRRKWPHLRARIVLLALFDPPTAATRDAFERVNIPDPFGKDAAAFDQCYRRLDASVRQLMTTVMAGNSAQHDR